MIFKVKGQGHKENALYLRDLTISLTVLVKYLSIRFNMNKPNELEKG